MENFTTRSAEEAKTLELLDGYETPDDLFTTTQCVKMAIRSCWSASMTVERFTAVATVLGGMKSLSQDAVQTVLTRMTRAKILRSRKCQGKKLYEVNF